MTCTKNRPALDVIRQQDGPKTLLRLIDTDSCLVCWCANLAGEEIFTAPEVCHYQVIWKGWLHLHRTGTLGPKAQETS